MIDDPIVAEVRAIREAYAAKFNYDVHAMFEDLREQQRLSGRQYVSFPPKRIAPPAIASIAVPETPASSGAIVPAR